MQPYDGVADIRVGNVTMPRNVPYQGPPGPPGPPGPSWELVTEHAEQISSVFLGDNFRRYVTCPASSFGNWEASAYGLTARRAGLFAIRITTWVTSSQSEPPLALVGVVNRPGSQRSVWGSAGRAPNVGDGPMPALTNWQATLMLPWVAAVDNSLTLSVCNLSTEFLSVQTVAIVEYVGSDAEITP